MGVGYIVLGKLFSEHINSYKREYLHLISHTLFCQDKVTFGAEAAFKVGEAD